MRFSEAGTIGNMVMVMVYVGIKAVNYYLGYLRGFFHVDKLLYQWWRYRCKFRKLRYS